MLKNHFIVKWFLYSALMAGGYFLAGRLGQLLAVPPSYPTPIWPASGIALVGILLVGYRLAPGVFLGALLVNGWTPLFNADSFELSALLVPASISTGATAQALLGAFLIRRLIGFPNPLIQDRSVLAFLLIGGPLSCLVGASWGVTSLAFAGIIKSSQIALNWWTWWVGDVIGVIIFAPLMLICFARPRHTWRPRWLSVALPLGGAFTVTVAGYVSMQVAENTRAETQFERITANHRVRIEQQLVEQLDALYSVESFYASSREISRSEFASFNRHLLSRHPAVRAIAWLPLVSNAKRESHESQIRSLGKPKYRLTERTDDHSLIRCKERDEYFPVLYLESRQTGRISVGLDIAANPQWRRVMNQSRDSGKPAASSPVRLRPKGGGPPHILIFVPVYSGDDVPATDTLRRKSLRGFILGALDVRDIVRTAISNPGRSKFRLTILDQSTSPTPSVVFAQPKEESPHKATEVADILAKNVMSLATIEAVDREWQCRFTPTTNFFAWQVSRNNWFILASGLSLTALLGSFLLILSGRTARIEASEARYLDLYDQAPDMFISVDVTTQCVTECNKTFLEVTGASREEVIGRHIDALFDPKSQSEVQRAFEWFLAHGEVSDVELLLPCRDRQSADISMNVSSVRDEQGESINCRATLRDITARKRGEIRIKKQELELAHVARLSMMGEMAAGLAHEINQPLAAIAAYAEGAAIRLRDGNVDSSELVDVVDRISTDAHRAGEVIRRLRLFVRKREPDSQDIDLNSLVREVADFVAPDIKQHQVRISLTLGENLPQVRGDAIQIQQVLLNLVRNGCDAMEETDVERRHLSIRTCLNERGRIEVAVDDCGHGLSETLDEQVFEAFFSSKEEGLGMGLAISRSIIEAHGGRIWATTNSDGGASFRFSLPASEKVPQEEPQSQSASN